jgi:hypothetical protein
MFTVLMLIFMIFNCLSFKFNIVILFINAFGKSQLIKIKEELLPLEKIEAIQKQLIGFIYNKIISKNEEFYYDGRNLLVKSEGEDDEY